MNQTAIARSWVEHANGHSDFPLQNLPLGIFSRPGEALRCGVAIGDAILDLEAVLAAGLFAGQAKAAVEATRGGALNAFFALGRAARVALRERLLVLLGEHSEHQAELKAALYPASECQLHLPAKVGDYTDFYVGIQHATNVGKLFRPDNPLLPNYKYVPIGYHGRASTLRPSGAEVRRPKGQTLPPGHTEPSFGPARGWTTNWSWASGSAKATTLARPSRLPKLTSTWPACACSTIGRRGISRPGNTSHWARSCRRASSLRFRLG